MKKVFIIICVFFLPINCFGLTHAEYFDKYLKSVTVMLEARNYKGPIAPYLAQWALARQVLEDGINRKPNNSCAGISVGGFNKEAVQEILKDFDLKVGTVQDNEGGTFYFFSGEQANIASALIIAKLFETYVDKFFKKDKKIWIMAKETSQGIHQNPDSFELNHRFHVILNPEKIIAKGCAIYGPGFLAITQIINRSVK
jgi:hypothetical protein